MTGRERLNVIAQDVIVAAMSLEHVLERLTRGALVVVPGDREDVLLGLAAAYASPTVPNPSGVVMTGGLEPRDNVKKLIIDITQGHMPLLKVETDTYETAIRIAAIKPRLHAHQRMRTEVVKGLMEQHLDVEALATRAVVGGRSKRMTPKQFCTASWSWRASSPSTSCCPRARRSASCAPRRCCSSARPAR